MVPLQTDIPTHRTSLCPYARHRWRSTCRMSRSRHKKIQHCFCGVIKPNGGDQPAGKSDTGFYPIQRLCTTKPQMPFLQAHFPVRGDSHFHCQRHPRRHRMPSTGLQTAFLHPKCSIATRTCHPNPNIQVLRRPPDLRRQQLREPHAANERLWTPLSWTQRSRRRLSGPDEVRVFGEGDV